MKPNSLYESSITLIPKSDNDRIRKLQSNVCHKYKIKNSYKGIFKENSQYINYTP